MTEPSGITEEGPRGHCQPARRVAGAAQGGRARHPPDCPGSPPEAPLGLYYPLGVETLKRELFFRSTPRSRRKPSVLPRRANLEAELASGEGEIVAIVTTITPSSPTMTSSTMCE